MQTRKHGTPTKTTAQQFREKKVRTQESPNQFSNRLGEQIGIVCGVDLVELETFARELKLGGERFADRIFTVAERRYCRDRKQKLAARFAAKEAIAKALGTGIRGINWKEMEIDTGSNGQPHVLLHGRAQSLAKDLGLLSWAISLTHTESMAMAHVVALVDHLNRDPRC